MFTVFFAAVRAVSVVSEDITSEVRRRLKKEFGEKDIEKRVNMAIECVKRRAYITVFRQDGTMSGKNIDESILKALLKGSFTRNVRKAWKLCQGHSHVIFFLHFLVNQDRIIQLKLALAWNQIDIAQAELFNDKIRWQVNE